MQVRVFVGFEFQTFVSRKIAKARQRCDPLCFIYRKHVHSLCGGHQASVVAGLCHRVLCFL